MSTSTPSPPQVPELPGKPRSGRAFVVATVLFLVAFVIILLVASPRLLNWTLAQAPPPAPQEVGSGTLGGDEWTVTALEGDEDEIPCLDLAVGGTAELFCGDSQARGPAVQVAQMRTAGNEAVLALLTAPRLESFEIDDAEGTTTLQPDYVDFGFPAGYVVTPVSGPQATVAAYGQEGELAATVTCDGSGSCEIDEGTP